MLTKKLHLRKGDKLTDNYLDLFCLVVFGKAECNRLALNFLARSAKAASHNQ